MISVMLETWNLRREPATALATLAAQMRALSPHAPLELVVTHADLVPPDARPALEAALGQPITWCTVPASAGFYDHKNLGFAASRGDIVVFLDGDTRPEPHWLARLTAPVARGEAQVSAGCTTYPGRLASLGNLFDFPHFQRASTARHFWANNVAFARATFASYPFPKIAPMFHGQCQVLALQLRAAGIAIASVPDARVIHGWPVSARDWLEVRLLRGADTATLLPHIADAYVPAAAPLVRALGPVPALALLSIRALAGTAVAAARGPRGKSLALVAGCTAVDSIGALAAPLVYRRLA